MLVAFLGSFCPLLFSRCHLAVIFHIFKARKHHFERVSATLLQRFPCYLFIIHYIWLFIAPMLFNLGHLSLGLMILTQCHGQNNFLSEIPESESVALQSVIEDDPDGDMSVQKDWESPEYPLIFRSPLPIPPILQPRL